MHYCPETKLELLSRVSEFMSCLFWSCK